MNEIEKRILLNQREIMYALMNMNKEYINIAKGLGNACILTNNILENNVEGG